MGQLKENATYIYERVGDAIYSREFGSDPSTRKIIGVDYDPRTSDGRPLIEHLRDSKMWGEIHRMAETNPALQKALANVIMIYRLSKDNPL
ncbi:MAG: hypothetical protein RLZZ196_109 [Bacteroidota bacterium]|jgi:hypothetical protein